jgi:BirA family biotin operon repressor/biotin-[acetyl-CoA-carboxylase] ligase
MSFPGASQVLHLAETESTQTLARALAEGGAPDRTLVWADRQTAGRGRMKRAWKSPEGGLYFSLVLRPRFAPSRLADFSLATGAAIAGALQKLTGQPFAVKPPNDVYSAGPRPGKVCGILAEASGSARKLDWLVVGVGVNVNARPKIGRAQSLKSLTGRAWPVEDVLRAVLPVVGKTPTR